VSEEPRYWWESAEHAADGLASMKLARSVFDAGGRCRYCGNRARFTKSSASGYFNVCAAHRRTVGPGRARSSGS
jgi:hypothetical protein